MGKEDLMEVKNKLCEVLYRVDIMMRRWRDEGNSRLAAPEVSYIGANFLAWKLAALTYTEAYPSKILVHIDAHFSSPGAGGEGGSSLKHSV